MVYPQTSDEELLSTRLSYIYILNTFTVLSDHSSYVYMFTPKYLETLWANMCLRVTTSTCYFSTISHWKIVKYTLHITPMIYYLRLSTWLWYHNYNMIQEIVNPRRVYSYFTLSSQHNYVVWNILLYYILLIKGLCPRGRLSCRTGITANLLTFLADACREMRARGRLSSA